MAVTINTNMKIYEDEYISSSVETLRQNTAAFNEGSNGAMRLIDVASAGDFHTMSFFQNQAHLGRRNPTDVAVKAATRLQMGEEVTPKIYRGFMVDATRQAFRSIRQDMSLFSSVVGEQVGKQKAAGYVNTAIIAARSALSGSAASVLNIAAGEPFDTAAMIDGKFLMGDQAGSIAAYVMHSRMSAHLAKSQLRDTNVIQVAGAQIIAGTPASGGIPIIVTDSPALIDNSGTAPRYVCLGLVENGVRVEESEDEDVVTDTITGQGNIIERVQGEFAFNVGVTGFSYIKGTGANPDDATLAVSANYQQTRSSVKDLAGIVITAEL